MPAPAATAAGAPAPAPGSPAARPAAPPAPRRTSTPWPTADAAPPGACAETATTPGPRRKRRTAGRQRAGEIALRVKIGSSALWISAGSYKLCSNLRQVTQRSKQARPKASAPVELALPGQRVRPPQGEGAEGDSGGFSGAYRAAQCPASGSLRRGS